MSSEAETPRPSTSREYPQDARPSIATSRTTFHDPPTTMMSAPAQLNPELRRNLSTISSASSQTNDDGFYPGSMSGLAKLQTYLPTGTWVTYTALQTWAFSLRPNDIPTSPLSNCNSHQRIALIIIIALCAGIAFFSSFVKRFVYDTCGKHVVYPRPDYFTVRNSVVDHVTGVRFPCRTRANRYCWPLADSEGRFVHDENARLRVAVLRANTAVYTHRRSVWRFRACLGPDPDDDVPAAPPLQSSPPHPPPTPTPAGGQPLPPRVLSIDAIAPTPPELTPRWSYTILGSQGSAAYFDLRAAVWSHAFVSLAAFAALALLSDQVSGCLYPTIPDYLRPPVQTGFLAILAVVAAVGLRDTAVGVDQATVRLRDIGIFRNEIDAGAEVPEYLRSVVEMVVWVSRQDRSTHVHVPTTTVTTTPVKEKV